MSATWPLETLTMVIFEAYEKYKTQPILMWTPLNASAEEKYTFEKGKAGMEQGRRGSLAQLRGYLNGLAQ